MTSSPSAQPRALALDALRGFAILTMLLSSLIPFGVLPSWMYHAQVPPPHHQFNPNLPGITWVDLVFPFFLFSMGAAIPLALARRIDQGVPSWRLLITLAERGALLVGFSLYVMHIRPKVIDPKPMAETWLIGLLGFALLFPVLSRFPSTWKPWIRWSLRLFGWAGVIALMALLRYPGEKGFSLGRSDVIILVLANVAVFGSLVWWATRRQPLVRLGVLGLLLAIRLAYPEDGWVHWLWNCSPEPRIFKIYFLQYLFIVIPGTIVGDRLLSWMGQPVRETRWSPLRLAGIATLMLLFILLSLMGLKVRWLPQTTLATFALCGLGWLLLANPAAPVEKVLRELYSWGVYWLVLGLFLESYEGGIKKDHPTISYYFVTTGLAVFLLMALTILIDLFQWKRWFGLLIDNGQNPLIAYAGVNNFLMPLLVLTGLDPLLQSVTPTPWLGFFRGVFVTLLLALSVRLFTRLGILWRA